MLTRQVLESLVPLSDDMRTINKMRPGGTGLHIQWLWLLATVSHQQITVCVLMCAHRPRSLSIKATPHKD